MDLEVEREFQRGHSAKEASYHDELSANAKGILDREGIQFTDYGFTDLLGE